jgi:hypothetical protein
MPRRYYALLVLITLAAAGLRLWRLAEVPPGLHYDLAATALLGNEVAFHGYRPIFISAYTGHEPLFYYWLALWFRLAGSSVFTLRLAAALLGVLAVPAAFFALRESLRFEAQSGLPHAALGAAFLATAFFHVVFSRFGFRVIIEPVVQALAIGFLMRGLRKRSNVSVALAGLITGLAAYTYLAARLFPVPLAVFWLTLLFGAWRADRQRRAPAQATQLEDDRSLTTDDRPRVPASTTRHQLPIALRSFILFAASALLAFVPLGLYFLRHPEDFFNRAGQVVPRAGEAALLLDGVRRALEMVFLRGEPYDRYNLPGLPLFGPVLGFFFVAGFLVTVRNAFRPQATISGHPLPFTNSQLPLARSTEWLFLAWLPAMLLPTALAVHDVYPSNLRAFGLIPLLFVFPARGLLAAYRWLQQRLPGPLIPSPYPLLGVTVLALAGGVYTTGRQYFVEWANLPNQPQNNDADLSGIAAYLNELNLSSQSVYWSVYVSSIHYRHPTLAFLAREFDGLHWLTGGTSLAVPAEGAAVYAFARSAPPPPELIAAWEPHLVWAPLDPDNVASYRIYSFPPGETPPLPAFEPLAENFGNVLTLTGYDIVPNGEQLFVDVRWRVENVPEAGDFLPYARLADDALTATYWAQSGGFSYPSEQWRPGDVILARLAVPVPAGLPLGDYTVKVGFFSAGADASLPRLTPDGAYAGDRAPLPTVRLPGRLDAGLERLLADETAAITRPASRSGLDTAPALLGYHVNTGTPRQGERLLLTLYWHAAAPSAGAGPITLSLDGQALITGDAASGTLPLSQLANGQVLVDRHAVVVPADLAPGPTELSVSVPGAGSAVLASLDIQPVDSDFDPPSVATLSGASFHDPATGDPLLSLHGYTLTPGSAGTPTTLLLAWQARPRNDETVKVSETFRVFADYTLFVHVLDAAGQIAAQRDSYPRGGSYPTSLWQPGEYVMEDYAFDLSAGRYHFALGLYLAETGERLTLGNGDTALTLPEFIVP